MANRNGQRGGFSRFLLEGLDRAFLGNRAYDSRRDYWSGQGAIQGGIQSGLGAINPALGLGARLYFNRQNRNAGVLGTTTNPLTPATPIGYTPPTNFPMNPVQPFDPGQIVPDGQPSPQGTTSYGNPQQNRQGGGMGGMAGLSGIAAQMGGARGAYSQGGYTGDAARGLFASMTSGPQYFATYGQQPYNQ